MALLVQQSIAEFVPTGVIARCVSSDASAAQTPSEVAT